MNIPIWLLVAGAVIATATLAFMIGRRTVTGDPKAWWKSKSLWLNTAAFMLTGLEANFGTLKSFFGPEATPPAYLVASLLLAGANFVLRFQTSQPVK